jgi:hypothetical protein
MRHIVVKKAFVSSAQKLVHNSVYGAILYTVRLAAPAACEAHAGAPRTKSVARARLRGVRVWEQRQHGSSRDQARLEPGPQTNASGLNQRTGWTQPKGSGSCSVCSRVRAV